MRDLTFSILTPVYNSAKYIRQNLLSVSSQNYPDWEHIIFDNLSADSSGIIVDEHAACHANVRVYHERDAGQSDALNKAFNVAKGDIIGWLNADDYYNSGAFAVVAESFQANPKAQVLFGNAIIVDGNGQTLREIPMENFRFRDLRRGCYLIQPAVFFRRTAIMREFLNVQLHYAMDYDLWLRIFHDDDAIYTPNALASFRVHADAKTYLLRYGSLIEYYQVKWRNSALSLRDIMVLPYSFLRTSIDEMRRRFIS